MTAIGFTGGRETTPLQARYVRDFIHALKADVYVSGACTGVDEAVARAVAEARPEARNVIVVPAARSQITRGFLWDMGRLPGVEIVDMPSGTSYADRNREIVARSDRLIGFPPFPEQHPMSARSGSWQTIRMARQAHRAGRHTDPPEVHILTEEAPS